MVWGAVWLSAAVTVSSAERGASIPADDAAGSAELILCGGEEVSILRLSGTEQVRSEKIWSWRAVERPDLPDSMKTRFRTTDECKAVDGGRSILITSSGGGVALVDRATGAVRFFAVAANAHSAALLPGGWIAVAASHDPAGKGDRLLLFDQRVSEQVVCSDDLPWGHGAVWDAGRQILWGLAGSDIRAYRLRDQESAAPLLERIFTVPLPEPMGHNLSAVPGTPFLAISTSRFCWLFDRDIHSLILHPDLPEEEHVKSITVHPGTGRLAYTQGEGGNWWSERVHFLHPAGTLHLPGERLYKVRWNVVNTP